MDTNIDENLEKEGIARDFVRMIQALRKTKDFDKNEIEMVDADVNVEIDVPVINNYTDEDTSNIDIRQLEDDRNSSTGNI